ncbi:hypothetical protein UCDDA912_g10598 [Diaporthe ampelina]|uniref:Uncharacterized protein n=1 Tax=Diaporthe ampelina TaxID=1214573 RepID=A0A0G2H2F2_9PEZI|nr:hypothetical protein UCDDA912_g10598 [Diaporthe ampelina]
MPSSKGEPTDPELREELKEGKCFSLMPQSRIMTHQTNIARQRSSRSRTSREGASKLAKEYEKQGGGYENEPGSKNEPKKGNPEPKSDSKKKKETEED